MVLCTIVLLSLMARLDTRETVLTHFAGLYKAKILFCYLSLLILLLFLLLLLVVVVVVVFAPNLVKTFNLLGLRVLKLIGIMVFLLWKLELVNIPIDFH